MRTTNQRNQLKMRGISIAINRTGYVFNRGKILQGTSSFVFSTVALSSTLLSSSDEDSSDDSDQRSSENKIKAVAWACPPESESELVDTLE